MTIGTTHLPLRHAVLDEIRRRIVSGHYQPGERIYEEQVAADLGVSRNPVREAIQALAADGFIDIEPRRGVRVTVVSLERARELFEVREALEGLVAALAAARRTPTELDDLRTIVRDGQAAAAGGDLAALPGLNTRFHELMTSAARNALLADTNARLRHLIEWIYSQRVAMRAPLSWSEHDEIVEAVASGDASSAERAARAHIAHARAAYLQQLDGTTS